MKKIFSKKRKGFNLAELVIAMVIFGMMMTSLAAIYGTINHHMFQNYRANVVKSDLALAMKVIQNRLMTATRVDSPTFGNSSNTLAFTNNVDAKSGCSPINSTERNLWHYFCTAACPSPYNTRTCLYYHTGNVSRNTGGCPCSPTDSNRWRGLSSYPVSRCGPGGGGTVTLILKYVQPPLSPYPTRFFTRRSADGIREVDQVRVTLRSVSTFLSGRTVDATVESVVHTQTTP